jgi:hypothetical protein
MMHLVEQPSINRMDRCFGVIGSSPVAEKTS